MPVKLLMTWDISPEHEQEYFEFVIGEFIPGIQRMALEPVEAWATIYGEYPQIQVVMLSPTLSEAQRALGSTEWNRLRDRLFEFVRNYDYKIIPAKGGFQF